MEKWRGEELTEKIINACINVHKELGPGFLESIYHNALKIELERQKLAFESEKEIEVKYLDIIVGIHRIEMKKEIGLLVNFANFTIDVRRVESERRRD